MAKNWYEQMAEEVSMNKFEINIFLNMVKAANIPTLEEYTEQNNNLNDDTINYNYEKLYGDKIRDIRDDACIKADNLACQIKSYEDKGHYYFSDTQAEIETGELIDCSLVTYDEQVGYIYKGKKLLDYEI